MLKQTLFSMLNRSELTIKSNKYFIDCYKSSNYEISEEIFNKLNSCDLLVWDSGNLEFNEEHYILNCLHGLSSDYRLNIKRTLVYVRRRNTEILGYKQYSGEVLDVLLEFERLEDRKIKILKLKEKIHEKNI